MRTWEDYKNHVKAVSEEERRNMEAIEEVSDIVSSIIRRRQELGISQRALAERCGIPQSSVARIETLKTTGRFVKMLLVVLIVFYIIGGIVKLLIDKNFKDMEEETTDGEETPAEAEEKEEPEQESDEQDEK